MAASAMDMGGSMGADKADPTNMSEAEYVRMWQDYAAEYAPAGSPAPWACS